MYRVGNQSLYFLFLLFFLLQTSIGHAQGIETLPNYSFKYSAATKASKEDIWKLWSDVENWKKFDERIEYSRLKEGHDFSVGAQGYLKGKNAPKTAFELIEVHPNVSFKQRLKLPLYQTIELQRYFEESPDGQTIFTHEVNFKGRLKPLTYLLLCSAFKKDLELVIDQIQSIADQY